MVVSTTLLLVPKDHGRHHYFISLVWTLPKRHNPKSASPPPTSLCLQSERAAPFVKSPSLRRVMSRMVSLMTAAIGCRSVDVIAEVMTRRCMPNDSSDWQWAVLRSCPQEPRCMWDSALAYEQCAVDNPVVIYLEFQLQSQPSPSFLSSDRPHFVIFILRTSQQS